MSRYVLLVAGSEKMEHLGVIAPGQQTRLRDTRMRREEIMWPEHRPLMGSVLETFQRRKEGSLPRSGCGGRKVRPCFLRVALKPVNEYYAAKTDQPSGLCTSYRDTHSTLAPMGLLMVENPKWLISGRWVVLADLERIRL